MQVRFMGVVVAVCAMACSPVGDGPGGISAELKFAEPAQANGLKRQKLDARIGAVLTRLRIRALDPEGTLLSEVTLAAVPADGELQLSATGGDWVLDNVASGSGRIIRADAWAGSLLLFSGDRTDIEVVPGQVTDVGEVVLESTGERLPELDETPPSTPTLLAIEPVTEGESLMVTFAESPEPDTVGYLVAAATATAAGAPPVLARGDRFSIGESLGNQWAVRRVVVPGPGDGVRISGLTNEVAVALAVFAFDDDGMGAPLNWSAPAVGEQTPVDRAPPAAPSAVGARDRGTFAEVRFVAPGEDDSAGTAARYEVRASTVSEAFTGPETFAALPEIAPPEVAAAGVVITFLRTKAELGVPEAGPFYVGARAIDASGNVGPIGFGVSTTTQAPTIDAIVPPIVTVPGTVQLFGRDFQLEGTAFVQATETATSVVTAQVLQWTDTMIELALPPEARSGDLVIQRADGYITGGFVPVLLREDDQVGPAAPPFELVGAASTMSLYRETNADAPYDAAITRTYGVEAEGIAHAEIGRTERATAVGGTYSAALDRFFFATTDSASMTTSTIRSDEVAPDPTRLPAASPVGGADRISAVFLDGVVAGAAPAMLTLTTQGVIATATVADATVDPFGPYFVQSSTVVYLDGATMARNALGQTLMLHRADYGFGPELTLQFNLSGTPFDWQFFGSAIRVVVGPDLEIRNVPAPPGETFLVAYEELTPMGNVVIRLALLQDYGARLGYAPLPPDPGFRLDDVGAIVRRGEIWLVVVASRLLQTGTELYYVEVPLLGLLLDDAQPPVFPWAQLAFAPEYRRARLGCKPDASLTCTVVWMGETGSATFYRR